MLDIKFIRENPDIVKKAIKDKQLAGTVDVDELLNVEKKYRGILQNVETHRALRNQLSENVSKVEEKEREKLIDEATKVKAELTEMEDELKTLKTKYDDLMLWVPNVPADDVPYGEGEEGNVVHRTKGEKPKFDFEPKDHLEIGTNLNIIDVERGVKIGGYKSYFIKGAGMLLEQAILKYSLDFMVAQGFTPMNVPVLVNKESLIGTGYFPWGEEDHYVTQDNTSLIGTAEVSLTSYHSDETLNYDQLPVLIVGQSPCFRREVGAHGKYSKGVFRVHYFNKVEQVVLCQADEKISREWHEKMLSFTEQILDNLKIHYNVMLMCTGDIGAGQRKKYDINVWWPSLNDYLEIGSASYFNDFQSRRLNMKYKDKDGKAKYVHTLNNTVLPTPRMLANILENYQQKDGSVKIPKALHPYMNGLTEIKKSDKIQA